MHQVSDVPGDRFVLLLGRPVGVLWFAMLLLQMHWKIRSIARTFPQDTLSSWDSILWLGPVLVVIKTMLHKLKRGQMSCLVTFAV